MLVELSHSQVMALGDILLAYIQQPDHTQVFCDVTRNVETTAGDLLRLFVDLGAGFQRWPDKADRDALLLALAVLSLDRPGWLDYLQRIAQQLDGVATFAELRRCNEDRWQERPLV